MGITGRMEVGMTALSFFIVCMFPCLGAEPLVVTMRAAASASGEFVKVADVACVTGPAGEVMLGRAPKEDELKAMSRSFVASRLAQEGFLVRAVLGPEETVVAGRHPLAAQIEEAVRQAISLETGRNGGSLALNVLTATMSSDLGPTSVTAAASREFGGPLGRSLYRVATGAGEVHALVHVAERHQAPVETPRAAVRRGMTVRVKIESGALRISTEAVALESGDIGQTITLRNPGSGQDFAARVTGPGTATPE